MPMASLNETARPSWVQPFSQRSSPRDARIRPQILIRATSKANLSTWHRRRAAGSIILRSRAEKLSP